MKPWLLSVISCLSLAFSANSAWAYYSVLDNGEILGSGKYKLTGDVEALTSSGAGVNAGARFDMGFEDEYGLRALVGVGKTDIFFGGYFKWMPIPDIDNQPAIGFNVGLLYGKDGDERDLTVRLEPLVSKRFHAHSTVWTPYASLPLGLRMKDQDGHANSSYVACQIVAGTQLEIEQWKNLQFIGEVGADLANAFSYVSLGAIFYFDSENGFQLK